MAIPSKLTTYFKAGKPVLAAVYPVGNTAALVDAAGAGRVVSPGDPRVLLDEATRLASDREQAREFGLSGRTYAAVHMASGDAVRGIIDHLAELAGVPVTEPVAEPVAKSVAAPDSEVTISDTIAGVVTAS